jgi:hypothetical protein
MTDRVTTAGGKAEMQKAYTLVKEAYQIIARLADAESSKGYGSVGSALEKMRSKAATLGNDAAMMAKDAYKGAQRVGG